MHTPFTKYHALGNDYLVLDPKDADEPESKAEIIRICHRHYGLGSDGILYGPVASPEADFGLRIYNPDGSEAEKSGNGLRIFCRYLFDRGLVGDQSFTVWTLGGIVTCRVFDKLERIQVEMGHVSFDSERIPVRGPARQVLNETIELKGREYTYCAATIGNPHAVFPMENIAPELVQELGPIVEKHPNFPNRTNVQFMKVMDRTNIQLEIWERGAGYTLASGSSSSAAACVARRLGLVEPRVTVHMPGGTLVIEIGEDFAVTMTGAVTRVGAFLLDPEALD